jgi:hypothetical protein
MNLSTKLYRTGPYRIKNKERFNVKTDLLPFRDYLKTNQLQKKR